ncbi:PucR family transcriptional regulator [Leucobacter soli]|uniref:PucR family transcriptional regulator n=1 Tax=Leucobacter soli TaxID=2812850 RepID=UPI00360E9D82
MTIRCCALSSRAHWDRCSTRTGEKPELLHTLETFIRSGCRTGPTAEELHVHRHTVTYRLNQITQLVGLDPRSGDSLLEYTAALRLYRAGVVKCEDITDRTR